IAGSPDLLVPSLVTSDLCVPSVVEAPVTFENDLTRYAPKGVDDQEQKISSVATDRVLRKQVRRRLLRGRLPKLRESGFAERSADRLTAKQHEERATELLLDRALASFPDPPARII